MSMEQVPSTQSQLDRIEAGVKELNERTARTEERQHNQGAKIEAHDGMLADHSQRIRHVELNHAVAQATGTQQYQHLSGRWKIIGTTAIAAASIAGAFLSRIIFP
ncbi:hypothetical protein [Halomonas elongata]|uniref:Uncharacterized protein n=1 Tax=Halomonas elongata (strain ATCC 33173 / DSM 2581 / NBRC 15536 / NCIMB 2198 / 1H9) TaxID=768066 RepID=A0ABZ0TBD3_HALED|nr:hypothetical protein [Halomonas elongata]WBF19225.1 hypothetical protein LM502_05920 [Halomonas elongata]WPU48085.1 hypothetical protein SR933_04145 [Halomonas elongata DSM 2581]